MPLATASIGDAEYAYYLEWQRLCTPHDALRCFLGTEMDVLVLENFVVLRSAQREELTKVDREKYLSAFALD